MEFMVGLDRNNCAEFADPVPVKPEPSWRSVMSSIACPPRFTSTVKPKNSSWIWLEITPKPLLNRKPGLLGVVIGTTATPLGGITAAPPEALEVYDQLKKVLSPMVQPKPRLTM